MRLRPCTPTPALFPPAHSTSVLALLQGQGGISKATVSIVFHNDDPRQSPAGYEHCETITVTRTIVIGGRNKYLINGHAVQAGAVADFFHSVQLNVNNPHFLIMQVRPRGPPPASQPRCWQHQRSLDGRGGPL